jgi:tetratricopeptide (TPR) repeat protein
MKTGRPRLRLIIRLLPALAVLGVAAALWPLHQRRQVALAHVPQRPASAPPGADWPAVLDAAEASARSWRRPGPRIGELGRLYHANGFAAEASLCYAGAIALEPRNPLWPHLLAHLAAGNGRLEDAFPLWREVVRLDAAYLPARIRLGDVLLKINRTSEAAAVYAEVLARESDHPFGLLGTARCRIAEGDWNGAREILLQARRRHPNFVGTLVLLLTVHEHSGAAADARALRAEIGMREPHDIRDPWFDALLDDCHDAYRVSVGAAVATYSGDTDSAIRLLERAIRLAPDRGTYRRQLGKLLYQLERPALARPHLERAVALSPEDADAWSLLVDLLSTLKDEPALQAALTAGLAKNPNSAGLRFAHGSWLARRGRVGEAIGELRHAQRLRPDEARPSLELAMLFFRQERIDEGLAELRRALVAEPGQPLALSILTRHSIETGDEPAARRGLEQLRAQPRLAGADLDALVRAFRTRFQRPPW